MRKLILLLCCTISSMVLFAQTTTSQTENCINCQSTIDPSAAFEIRTTTQGILIPKMSAAEKEAIQNPAKGLLVFDTTNDNFYYFNGATWESLAGKDGLAGPRGSQGIAGVQGIQGVPGPRGVQGVQGKTGPRGAKGQHGALGQRGATGAVGPRGATGQRGATGAIGPRGATGQRGAAGAVGPKGATGQRGATGAIGPRGATGQRGAAGAVGPKGATGLQGNIGARGPKGNDGSRGLRGYRGHQGARGPRGFQGFRGHQGYQGPAGARGPQGVQGTQGIRGPKGARGAQGPAGPCCSAFLEDELEGIALLRTAVEEQRLVIDHQIEEITSLREKLITLEVMIDKLTIVASSNSKTKNKTLGNEAPVGESQEKEITTYTLVLKDDILLKQNYPNPFKSNTTIEYYIPVGSQEASLSIKTIDGKNLGSLIIKETGAGKVDIEVEDASLLSGILIYSLYVDGELFESKKMTVNR